MWLPCSCVSGCCGRQGGSFAMQACDCYSSEKGLLSRSASRQQGLITWCTCCVQAPPLQRHGSASCPLGRLRCCQLGTGSLTSCGQPHPTLHALWSSCLPLPLQQRQTRSASRLVQMGMGTCQGGCWNASKSRCAKPASVCGGYVLFSMRSVPCRLSRHLIEV